MFSGSDKVYYLMYLVGFAAMLIYNLFTYGNYKLKKKEAVISTVITWAAGVSGAMLMGRIFTAAAQHSGCDTGSRVAIFGAVVFTPVIMSVILRIMKKDVLSHLDLLTPGIFIILTSAKLGCFLNGCCAGFDWEYGIYNPVVGCRVFPVQICEVAFMLLLVVLTQRYIIKSAGFTKGTAYPLTAGIYAVIRFCWEFARRYDTDELRHFFLGLSFWQLWCIFTLLCSLCWFIVLKQKEKKAFLEKEKTPVGKHADKKGRR